MPDQALQRLLDGNRRYAANLSALDISPGRRIEVAQEQKPFAMVLGCVDSRVPPEVIFDQGLGDLLVVRTAAVVLDQAVLGSLEFGAAMLNIPLLVVLGHEQCGAVKAAVDVLGRQEQAQGNIAYLVNALKPAVERAKHQGGDLLEQTGRAQVALQVEQLMRSPILAEAAAQGRLKIVGARYHLTTGLVEFSSEEQ